MLLTTLLKPIFENSFKMFSTTKSSTLPNRREIICSLRRTDPDGTEHVHHTERLPNGTYEINYQCWLKGELLKSTRTQYLKDRTANTHIIKVHPDGKYECSRIERDRNGIIGNPCF